MATKGGENDVHDSTGTGTGTEQHSAAQAQQQQEKADSSSRQGQNKGGDGDDAHTRLVTRREKETNKEKGERLQMCLKIG